MSYFLIEYILFLCAFFRLDKDTVFGIGLTESGFDQNQRFRYEPGFYEKYILGKDKYKSYPPLYISSSYGYYHIMATTAEMVGYDIKSHSIHIDTVNIFYALKHLHRLKEKYKGNETDIIAAYNAGSVYKVTEKKKEKYKNQQYVDTVLKNIKEFKSNGIKIEDDYIVWI